MPHNSTHYLNYRLLELLPVAVVKDMAGKKLSGQESIKRILAKRSSDEIQTNFIKFFDVCKQHVHVFSLDGDVPTLSSVSISEVRPSILEKDNADLKVKYSFYKTTQKFVGPEREGVLVLDFIWPVKIVVSKEYIKVHVVLLEHGTESVGISRSDRRIPVHTEDQLLNYICLKEKLSGKVLNIDRGVKHMWKSDIIDSSRVQVKDSKSTKIESMDHGLLFKAEYPKAYVEYVQKPLLKTVFHVVKDHQLYGKKFVVDPSFGRVGFISYSSAKYIDNVISYILKNN